MPMFRKKPVVIEAWQFLPASSPMDIPKWISLAWFDETIVLDEQGKQHRGEQIMTIPTLEGDHTATTGDWIIKGVKGEVYPCKPDIFAMTYEPAP